LLEASEPETFYLFIYIQSDKFWSLWISCMQRSVFGISDQILV